MRAPKQRRSQETLRRLREAGLRLIDDAGADALTVQEVAKSARSSVGSFYQRFRGKDEFLIDLWTHENQRVAQAWERRLDEVVVDRAGLVCELAGLLEQAERGSGAALRDLRDYLARARLLPESVAPFGDRVAELVLGAITARARSQGVVDAEKAARIVTSSLFLHVETRTAPRAPYASLVAGVDCADLEAMLRPDAGQTRSVVDPFDVWTEGGDWAEPEETVSGPEPTSGSGPLGVDA